MKGARGQAKLAPADELSLAKSVDVFRDRVDYSIENVVAPSKNFLAKLESTVKEHRDEWIRTERDQIDVETILGWVTSSAAKTAQMQQDQDLSREEAEDGKSRGLNSEQVQEQEQEQASHTEEGESEGGMRRTLV